MPPYICSRNRNSIVFQFQSKTTAIARPAGYKKIAVAAVFLVTVAGLVCLMFYLGATSTTKAHEVSFHNPCEAVS